MPLYKYNYARAEVECLPNPVSPDGASRPSRLAWSDKRQHLEFMAGMVAKWHTEQAHWVGLDERDHAGSWKNRLKRERSN